jgi:hypothetical protein
VKFRQSVGWGEVSWAGLVPQLSGAGSSLAGCVYLNSTVRLFLMFIRNLFVVQTGPQGLGTSSL